MNTLAYLRGRRIWLVPGFVVWGASSGTDLSFVTVNVIEGQQRISHTTASIGGAQQQVSFNTLVDHRGNQLPMTINSPKVIPLANSDARVFIVSREFTSGFVIARDNTATTPVTTDLLIMELD